MNVKNLVLITRYISDGWFDNDDDDDDNEVYYVGDTHEQYCFFTIHTIFQYDAIYRDIFTIFSRR